MLLVAVGGQKPVHLLRKKMIPLSFTAWIPVQVAVDVADAEGATALVLASRHCQVKAVKLLIDRGSDVNHLMPASPGSSC